MLDLSSRWMRLFFRSFCREISIQWREKTKKKRKTHPYSSYIVRRSSDRIWSFFLGWERKRRFARGQMIWRTSMVNYHISFLFRLVFKQIENEREEDSRAKIIGERRSVGRVDNDEQLANLVHYFSLDYILTCQSIHSLDDYQALIIEVRSHERRAKKRERENNCYIEEIFSSIDWYNAETMY